MYEIDTRIPGGANKFMLMSKCRRQLLSYQIKLLLSSSSPGHYMYLGSDLNMCRVTGNVNLSPCDERYSGKFCPVRNFGPGNDNQSWHQQGTSSLRRLWLVGPMENIGTICARALFFFYNCYTHDSNIREKDWGGGTNRCGRTDTEVTDPVGVSETISFCDWIKCIK